MRFPSLPRFDLRLGNPGFYAAALLALFAGYAAILALTTSSRIATSAAANVLSLAIPAIAIRLVLRRFVFGRSVATQAFAHAVLGSLFTILWFWLLMVLLGITRGENAIQFSVEPFLGAAAAWQLFQGLTFYTLLAVTAYAETMEQRARLIESIPSAEPRAQDFRLFIKQDDELRPLDTNRIVLVRGADDYSEMVTATGTHLVRMRLAVLGERLGDHFIRLSHRSASRPPTGTNLKKSAFW